MLAVAVWRAPVRAQMSPGELSRAHQDVDTPLRCGACHEFGARKARFRCLNCHAGIRRRLEERRGYHARVVRGTEAEASNECAQCHSEHNGRNHRLVRWKTPRNRFDHREAGWALEGKHARLACEQCHNPQKTAQEERGLEKRTDPSVSLLGLNARCTACHEDAHRGQLGQECSRCHSSETWKPASRFSHEKTNYPLTGLHERVACEKCHRKIAALGDTVQYRNFVFYENCRSCHQDPHGGSFAGDCQTCHNTSGWKGARIANRFDHSKTKFPLAGRHRQVECRQCHKSENFRAPLPHGRCIDCHRDSHQGQFAGRSGGECAPCHSETGWKPARFGAAEHASTKFPLRGKHAAVACGSCHPGSGAGVNYHPAFASCNQCHKDRHGGQFAGAPHGNRCEHCHEEASWQEVHYTVRDHSRSRFPLAGAHAAVPCSDCHKKGDEGRVFRLAETACRHCHADPHLSAAELTAGEKLSAAAKRFGCESCHVARAWRETQAFDHDRTRFRLAGKHRGVPCTGCHKPAVLGARRLTAFAGTPEACASCHADPHAGQFSAGAAAQPDCARCHTVSNWRPTEFDHHKHSGFSLAGAHERVPCRLCHPARQQGELRVVVYRGIPRACQGCHQ